MEPEPQPDAGDGCRDEPGHTHNIPWSLGRASSESRWKSLRTLNSPNSFSESSTPAQPQQIRVFSNEFQPGSSPPIPTPIFFTPACWTGVGKRSIDHWVCCLPVFAGGFPVADQESPGSELPCLQGLPYAGSPHGGLNAARGPGVLARKRNEARSHSPGFQPWLSGCPGIALNPAWGVFLSVKWG